MDAADGADVVVVAGAVDDASDPELSEVLDALEEVELLEEDPRLSFL
mgnify:CR=1 FL=1